MKKLFTLILATGVASSLSAQALLGVATIINDETRIVPIGNAAVTAAADTLVLGLDEFLQASAGIYPAPAGYASGTLLSVDTFSIQGQDIIATTTYVAFSEGYLVNDDYTVLGAMFFAGVLGSASGTNPDITVSAQLIQDNKAISNPATVQSPDIPGPGQTLASTTVAFDDVVMDPNQIEYLPTFVEFASMPTVSADFCVTVNISQVYAGTPIDTIAIVTTADGEGDELFTYHRISQQVAGSGGAIIWTPTEAVIQSGSGAGVNINFAIFPIVTEFVGIEEAGYFDGLKMTSFPNPALSSDNITIQYGLETAAKNVNINIYNLNGQVVYTVALANKASGLYNVNVPAGTLSAGSYVYSIDADGRRMAKQMEILK